MFGYVKPKREELKIKDDAFYKATYCGICKRMKALLGPLSTATLTYDSVFLALLRMTLVPDEDISASMRRCALHPVKKRNVLNRNDALDYTVRVFAELTYLKLEDDLSDESGAVRMAKRIARPTVRKAKARSGLDETLALSMKAHLARISALEMENCPSADLCAAPFGDLLAEVFAYEVEDKHTAVGMREIGQHLGIFIYIADAAEDYTEDMKKGRFNPLVQMYEGKALTDSEREDIHTALCYHISRMEEALMFVDFGKKETLRRILSNIITLGLRERIAFLKGEEK